MAVRMSIPAITTAISSRKPLSMFPEYVGSGAVYNLQGVKVYDGPRNSHNLPSGIYIVRTPSQTTKIHLR